MNKNIPPMNINHNQAIEAISNNIPKMIKRLKLYRLIHKAIICILLIALICVSLTSCSDWNDEPYVSMGIEEINGIKYHRIAVKGGMNYVAVVKDGKLLRK